MKTRIIVLSIMLFPIIVSCNEDNTSSLEDEQISVEKLWDEIIEMAESVSCVNSDNWAFTPIGSKPCGGPAGYLAYSLDIDTEYFLRKVEEHRKAQMNMNIKLGLFSNCLVQPEPNHVEC